MNISDQKFEDWRKEQIASLIRMGYPDAANAFLDLGSIHWAGWQAAWKASRESLVIDKPEDFTDGGSPNARILIAHHREIVRRWVNSIESAGLKVIA